MNRRILALVFVVGTLSLSQPIWAGSGSESSGGSSSSGTSRSGATQSEDDYQETDDIRKQFRGDEEADEDSSDASSGM